jgi:hypothetical protein
MLCLSSLALNNLREIIVIKQKVILHKIYMIYVYYFALCLLILFLRLKMRVCERMYQQLVRQFLNKIPYTLSVRL